MVDWLRRVLESLGYEVIHVKNITDVGHMRQEQLERGDDKVIAAALAEGKTPQEIAHFYTEAFLRDERRLNILSAHYYPKASEHVEEMIRLVERLLEKGYAYERSGNVYFRVSAFPTYGRLSGQTGPELLAGVRSDVDPLKEDPRDFALWKAAEPGRLLKWLSPWGYGFPGWHIECSAMAIRYLGPHLDIHTGGVDNIFPHHEDEIAQSEAAYDSPFARYWVHGAHLLVDGLKMAKSTGNVYTLSDLEARGFHPLAFRYLCATVHYRHPMNFTWEALRASQRALSRLQLHTQTGSRGRPDPDKAEKLRKMFWEAVCYDLSLPRALAVAWEVARSSLPSSTKRRLLLEFDSVLGLALDRPPEKVELPADIASLARARDRLRCQRRYADADALRAQIEGRGYEVRDGRRTSRILLRPKWKEEFPTISRSTDVPSLLHEPPQKRITVSLLARDNLPHLQPCIDSLLPWLREDDEIILVDNGSTDETVSFLEHLAATDPRVRVLRADHFLGEAMARNVTLRQAKGRWFLWLDSSVRLTGPLEPYLERLSQDPTLGIMGRWGLYTADLRHFYEVELDCDVDALQGYLMLIPRMVIQQVTPLDEKFRFYRHLGLDLSFRVRALGWRTVCCPDIPAYRSTHWEWERLDPHERDRLSKRNFYRFLRRWGNRVDLLVKKLPIWPAGGIPDWKWEA